MQNRCSSTNSQGPSFAGCTIRRHSAFQLSHSLLNICTIPMGEKNAWLLSFLVSFFPSLSLSLFKCKINWKWQEENVAFECSDKQSKLNRLENIINYLIILEVVTVGKLFIEKPLSLLYQITTIWILVADCYCFVK